MAIHRIALKNFKCFKEVEVNLSKITLLTGENSSGKSSLMYGLLAAFQSKDFPFYLSPNGKYVTMGDFEEISFNHKLDNTIGIDIYFEITGSLETSWGRNEFVTTTWIIDSNRELPQLNHLIVQKNDKDKIEIKVDNGYILNAYISPIFKSLDPNTLNFRADNIDELKELIESTNSDELKDLINSRIWEFMDGDLNYISSFRLEPERTYYQKTKPENKVGRAGEGYIDQILEWESQKAAKFKRLKAILKDTNLLNAIKTRKLRGGRFELRVKVKNKGIWASLADVGFGISQFLPIIVADLQLSDDSILLLAQPEIHLHPSVQATLADYFVKQVKETNKQYIIETHSEYLLNRIRLAIVKGEIAPTDVSVYYFENSLDGSITYPIEFRKNGQIVNAPQGFFETYMMDVLDIALHAEG